MKYTYSEEVREDLIAYHYYAWFEDFLNDVFKNTEFKEIVVEDFDSKRIYLGNL